MTQDRLRAALSDGHTALGIFLMLRTDPVAVEALSKAGWDYICIDMQHGTMGWTDTLATLQAISLGPATPLARVPANDPTVIGRVLDSGAAGVIVPMIETADQARQAVAACHYAPRGRRSYGPVRANILHGPGYFAESADQVMCIPMIETRQGVKNVEEIVAVPGVDAVYVGPVDLAITYGLPPELDQDDHEFTGALEQIVAACTAQGVVPGIHSSSALVAKRHGQGFRMVTGATDLSVLMSGFQADLRTAQQALARGTTRATT
jgi:4-hydroxy-2-oxoheptanedioate aldolase